MGAPTGGRENPGRRRFHPLLALPVLLGAAAVVAAMAAGNAGAPMSAAAAVSPTAGVGATTAGGPAAPPAGAPAPGDSAPGDPAAGRPGAAGDPAAPAPTPAATPAEAEPEAAAPTSHQPGQNPDLLPDLRPLAGLRPAQEEGGEDGGADTPLGSPFFTPDPLNPVHKEIEGPHREQLPGRNQAFDPTPEYTEAEKEQLADEGEKLFFSTTAWGQRPSQGALVLGDVLSCASCHSGPGFSDNRTHVVGPVREREFGHRQTPALFGVEHTAPYMWDGRNATLQDQARGAITSPLEMNAAREPTKRELDALKEFQIRRIQTPEAVPGVDYDPVAAARGEILFRTPRDVIDPSGEFAPGEKVACATCHSGEFFTDGKAHRIALPTFFTGDALLDPGRIGEDGNIEGFDTPSLLGVRFTAPYFHDGIAGDPTAPNNLLGGGLGAGALDGDVGAQGPAAARRALRNNVLPFYNNIRFNFQFTEEELDDLVEFLMTL